MDVVVAEPGRNTDRIDFKISLESDKAEYVEAKNLETKLTSGLKMKDKFVEALGKFDQSPLDTADSNSVLVIGTKRRGMADDLYPGVPGDTGPRESFKQILKNRDQFKELKHIGGPEDIDVDVIRVIKPDGTVIEIEIKEIFDELQ